MFGLALVTIVTACGGGNPDPAVVSAVGQNTLAATNLTVSAKVQRCVGRSLVDDLGEATAKAVGTKDPSQLPAGHRAAAVRAFNTCVPGSALSGTLLQQIAGGLTTVDAGLEKCVAKQLDGKVGAMVAMLSDPKHQDSKQWKLLDGCSTTSLAKGLIEQSLVSSGASPEVAACVVGKLGDELRVSEIMMQSKVLQSSLRASMDECRGNS